MNKSLTEGKIAPILLRFSLPFLIASLIQQAYSSVDIFFLGRLAAPEAVAGAGNGAILVLTIQSAFTGVATGGLILLGQYYGARDNKRAARATGNIIIIQLAVAAAAVTLTLTCGKVFIRLINVPEGADTDAWNYMRICSIGILFSAGFNFVSSVLRALGNSKTPMIFIAISAGVNIALDYIFVGVFHMGASGAAIATVIAQACSMAISIAYLLRNRLPFELSLRDARPDPKMLRTIFRLGIPISLQTVLNFASFIVIAAIINKIGLAAAAANGIVNNIINFYMIIPIAIQSALSAISAQNVGAGKPQRALQSTRLGILFSLAIAVPFTLTASLAPTPIVSLLTPEPEVIAASAQFLIPFSWDCLLVAFVFCINAFFNGLGITRFVAAHELVAAFAVRIPLSWVFSLIDGEPAKRLFFVGIGTPAATAASLVMCLIYYRVKLSGDKLSKMKLIAEQT
jgi:putative MATE family efflux protein